MVRDGSLAGVALAVIALAAACGSPSDVEHPPARPDDLIEAIKDHPSCALSCDPACEMGAVWQCPALAPWEKLSHEPECGAFDGKTFPAVVKGSCFATDPAADALEKTSATSSPVVLPDGRRLQAWGKEHVFDDFTGGFPAALMRIPGTRFFAVTDNGYATHSIRIVDGAALRAGAAKPVVSAVTYPPPRSLGRGLAYKADTKTLYAAGGTPDSRIYAFDLDEATGAILEDLGKGIALPANAIATGIGISPDGKTLLVGQATDTTVLVESLDPVAYGKNVGAIEIRHKDPFAVVYDPSDATGKTAYATLWAEPVAFQDPDVQQLVRLDTGALSATVIPVGKSPEEIAFVDDKYVVVANALSDTLSVVDRVAGNVVLEQKIGGAHGPSPTALAYDKARKRLYATLASENSLAVFDVDPSGPRLTLAGRVPTAWWPTSVAVDDADGGVFVLSGRGHGIGTDGQPQTITGAGSDPSMRLAGSIQAFDFPDAATLATTTPLVDAQNKVAERPGYPTVQCNGAPYDFPVPARPEDGASTKIKHVFFIVRENKTFDGLMGDMPGVDGDARFVMSPARMDVFSNTRAIAKAFTQLDNYYIDAEQSIQGHAWTVFGRSTDYTERRWVNIWGRGLFSVTSVAGVAANTAPQELDIFQFLKTNGVGVEAGAELVGGLAVRDADWPGGTSESVIPDTLGACYMAWRARVKCNPNDFTYSWLPNDHTFGLAADKPNPAVMIAVNDEATGMYLDGISHSPFWPSSLVIVVEDDPSEGGDHVDFHRTIALFASPWIKRGYVSHAHYDLASVHKLISAVYGKPYRNTILANAPLPLDIFTSTPDYTPFAYVPRTFKDTSCNPGGTVQAKAAEKWDFAEPDEQPGLAAHVWQHLRSLPAQR